MSEGTVILGMHGVMFYFEPGLELEYSLQVWQQRMSKHTEEWALFQAGNPKELFRKEGKAIACAMHGKDGLKVYPATDATTKVRELQEIGYNVAFAADTREQTARHVLAYLFARTGMLEDEADRLSKQFTIHDGARLGSKRGPSAWRQVLQRHPDARAIVDLPSYARGVNIATNLMGKNVSFYSSLDELI